MEEHRSVYFVDTDGKKKLLTDEIWNALSSGSDDDFDDSDEDPTFNPNVLFNRNSEDISDNNNDSESSENEVNIQNESSTSGNKTLEEKSKKVKKEKIKLVWKKKSLQVNPEIITFSGDTHVQQTPEKPLNVTSSDIRKYLGICILSSVSSVKDFRLYWNPAVGISLIQNSMPVNEFEKIRRYLHFNDNNAFSTDLQGGQDKFFKLRPLIDELQKSFLSIPMEECLCVDEQMCATKARHHLKQYMPDKPHKYGYKLFILSGVSGFAYNFEIYGGKELDVANILQEPDLGASSNVVIRLTRPVQENVNHKLYFDNYYTSIPLQVYLKKKGILSLGTIRRNRIPDCKLPTERELKLQVRGSITEFVAEYDGCELSNVSWKDNKTVTMLSTFAGTNPVSEVQRFDRKQKCHVKVNCPYVIKTYNKHMGGVDLLDSLIGRIAKISIYGDRRRWKVNINHDYPVVDGRRENQKDIPTLVVGAIMTQRRSSIASFFLAVIVSKWNAVSESVLSVLDSGSEEIESRLRLKTRLIQRSKKKDVDLKSLDPGLRLKTRLNQRSKKKYVDLDTESEELRSETQSQN
ncbi:piggyBac transposable element-derived protein 3-like [Argiope bruennichi]|uniref:piggyBac transposable element-derived protein 3-like n=1 Tax=Argiope bruennichi TaxID=94029 RepID=UPI0024946F0D|nr:piggyBac transposable element-derived protein 3-like [Argiope bruennichi]